MIQRYLADVEQYQPFKRGGCETVAVQANAKHVHTEP